MAGEHSKFQARRVVTGLDANGKSTVVKDEITPRRSTAPAFTVCDIWETESLPIALNTPAAVGEVQLYPPKTGFDFRVCCFPPDSEFDKKAAYEESLVAIKGGDTYSESDVPGMHVHDTLDIVTCVSGEFYCVLETEEVLLRPGDSIILHGVMHSWSNKTDKPVVLTSLMMGATKE